MNPRRGSSSVAWAISLPCLLVLALASSVSAQNPATPPAQTDQQPATAPQPTQQTAPAPADAQPASSQQPDTSAQAATPQAVAPQATPSAPPAAGTKPPAATQQKSSSEPGMEQGGGITEEELKQMLVGKTFYLRSGYLDDSLSFNEHGKLASRSPVGSYTLSMVQIDKVRLSKHKVELEGLRYGQHFSSQLAYEDAGTAFDKVRITPKKKVLRITIDRESVVKPKKVKEEKERRGKGQWAKPAAAQPVSTSAQATATTSTATPAPADQLPSAPQPASSAATQPTTDNEEPDTDQTKAEIAAAKPEERPADPDSVTSTTSPAHATMVLKKALDTMFAPGLDDRMMAAMPDFWKLYYKAVAAKADYRPADPTVLRQSTVDKKARLLTNFEPDSNEFAQNNGVAGMALYHTVIGADGTPAEIAVARPIGFGLDENAVKAIRAAKFEPAEKDGKPVPVLLDLVVQFRIYSHRTNVQEAPAQQDAAKPPVPALPGPFSVEHPSVPEQQSAQ